SLAFRCLGRMRDKCLTQSLRLLRGSTFLRSSRSATALRTNSSAIFLLTVPRRYQMPHPTSRELSLPFVAPNGTIIAPIITPLLPPPSRPSPLPAPLPLSAQPG